MIYVFSPNVLAQFGKTNRQVRIIAMDDEWNLYITDRKDEVYFHPTRTNPPDKFDCQIVNPTLKGKDYDLKTSATRGKATPLLRKVAGAIISSSANEDWVVKAMHNCLSKEETPFKFKVKPDGEIDSSKDLVTAIFLAERGHDFEIDRREHAEQLALEKRQEEIDKQIQDRAEAEKTPVGKLQLWDETVGENDDKFQWERMVKETSYDRWSNKLGKRKHFEVVVQAKDWDSFLSKSWNEDYQFKKGKGCRVKGTLLLVLLRHETTWYKPWDKGRYIIDIRTSRT